MLFVAPVLPALERILTRVLVGPGLAKVRPAPEDLASGEGGYAVVAEKHPTLWLIRETWVARLLEESDIFSEGEAHLEATARGERRVYYGSTSIRCGVGAVRARVEGLPEGEVIAPTELAQALLANPHARLCAVRIARRVACARAGAALNVMHAELSARVLRDADGIRLAIDVDVSAEVARLHDGVLRDD